MPCPPTGVAFCGVAVHAADHPCTATGLVQADTQWTNSLARSAENPLNKRDSRTHQDGLGRVQANS
jgi:hypothetical protein